MSRRPGIGAQRRRGFRGIGGAVGWNPTADPTLQAYWRGDQGVTVSADVSGWTDSTPNTNTPHNATRGTNGGTLIENDTDFNGHNSVSFDGVNDWFTSPDSADFELGTGLTIYIVAKVPDPGANNTLMAKRATIGTDMSWRIQVSSGGGIRWLTTNAANSGVYTAIGPTPLNDTAQVIKVRHAAGVDSAIRVDSDSETVAAAPDEVASSTGTLNIFSLNTAGTHYMPGKCARILIYKENLSDGGAPDLAIMSELDAMYKGTGTPTQLDFSAQGNLVADFDADKGPERDITAIADQTGNGHDLSYSAGTHFQQVLAAASPHHKTDLIAINRDGATPGKYTWGVGPIDAGAGEHLDIYVIGKKTSLQADAEGSVRQMLNNNSGSGGWLIRTQKYALGDSMYEYIYDGAVIVKTKITPSADAVWAPGVGQVLHYRYDGDGTSHAMGAEKGAPHTTWSTTGHTPNTTTVGYIGHAGAANCPTGEFAAILIFKSTTGINDTKHDQIMTWANNTFLKPFDPITQIEGAEVMGYWRADKGITLGTGTDIAAWADQSGKGLDLLDIGTVPFTLTTEAGFKTSVVHMNPAAGNSYLDAGTGNWINPPSGGRTVVYVAVKHEKMIGEAAGAVRIIATSGSSAKGWIARTQQIGTGADARAVIYQSNATGASVFDISGTEITDGGYHILRYQIDDTGAEELAVVDDGDHTPTAQTGYAPSISTTAGIRIGDAAGTSSQNGYLACILAINVLDRVPFGVHKKITQWMREEFFS